MEIAVRFDDFLAALNKRHDDFHALGARLSDHGLNQIPAQFASQSEAENIFDNARLNIAADAETHQRFAGWMMIFFGQLDAEKGWTKQLHLGARRNNSARMLEKLGPDTGFDSIGDYPQINGIGAYLDKLEERNALPQTIVYNLNPADNYALATLPSATSKTAARAKFRWVRAGGF